MTTRYGSSTPSAAGQVDQGLRAYMLRVYDFVGIGLAVSALTAYGVLSLATTSVPSEGAKVFNRHLWLTPAGEWLFSTTMLVVMFMFSIGLLFGLAKAVRSSSMGVALGAYVLFTATFGLNLAVITASYTSASVTLALAATAATFGSASIWGYLTKRDVSGWGAFLFMGLVGLIVVGLANALLIQSTFLQTAMAGVGVLVFVGFTAYDTASIKNAYSSAASADELNRVALWGAVDLFLDLVNLFSFLLQLTGSKDD